MKKSNTGDRTKNTSMRKTKLRTKSKAGRKPRQPVSTFELTEKTRSESFGKTSEASSNKYLFAWIITIFISLSLIVATLIFAYYYPGSQSLEKEPLPVTLNDEAIPEDSYLIYGERLALELDFLRENLGLTIFEEPETDRIILMTEDKIIEMSMADMTMSVNYNFIEPSPPLVFSDDRSFMFVDFLETVFAFKYDILPNGVYEIDLEDRHLLYISLDQKASIPL